MTEPKQIKVQYIDTSSTYVPRDMGLPGSNELSEEQQKYIEWATHMTSEAGEANTVQYLKTVVLLLPEFNDLLHEISTRKGLVGKYRVQPEHFMPIVSRLALAFALNLFTYDKQTGRLMLDTEGLKPQHKFVEIDGKRYDTLLLRLKIDGLAFQLVGAIGRRLEADITPITGENSRTRGKHLALLLAVAYMHKEAIEDLEEV